MRPVETCWTTLPKLFYIFTLVMWSSGYTRNRSFGAVSEQLGRERNYVDGSSNDIPQVFEWKFSEILITSKNNRTSQGKLQHLIFEGPPNR